MAQRYKAVYFPEDDEALSSGRSVTLAFGEKAGDLYGKVRALSSEEIRQLICHETITDLEKAAQAEDLTINLYCQRRLRNAIKAGTNKSRMQFGLIPDQNKYNKVAVTFKGGKREPFHRWYPYIEGYSPEFVETILETYAHGAASALDPFSGTGTTCIVTSQQKLASYCCEINPVLQFISRVKFKVHSLEFTKRQKVSNQLLEMAERISEALAYPRDKSLLFTYFDVFAQSIFFGDDAFDQVLRIRSWLDDIACDNQLLSEFLTLAVLSALVPSSNLKRAGDLRYKTSEEMRTQSRALLPTIVEQIHLIAEDIANFQDHVQKTPLIVAEDARILSMLPSLNIDVVITSPPYVNGTNYFRNTKIELWFLRCLHSQSDLSAFRARTVTAGINDVTISRKWDSVSPNVDQVVKNLEENSYDNRIPRMVACYFSDLKQIFAGISHHLNAGAKVCIDIGDSSYAGIHVPSDELLESVLQSLGFTLLDKAILRQRRSRDGSPLKQSLLVFKQETKHSLKAKFSVPKWWRNWQLFKEVLPHQKEPFSSRNWGHPLHSLCSYSGKLKPSIAYHLVKTFVPDGGRILDPFSGVGTIPFEAALAGKESFAFDISPLAVTVSTAKLQGSSLQQCNEVIRDLKGYVSAGHPSDSEVVESQTLGFNGIISDYYEKQTLKEILLARRFFIENPPSSPAQHFVLASMLHILHGNRPYALSRRSHPLTPYKPSGAFEYRSLINNLEDKVARSLKVALSDNFCAGKVYTQDATSWWPSDVIDLDAVITSPPFFDSTRFYLANWLRLWFSGWSAEDFAKRPKAFVDEKQKHSFDVYTAVLRQARERIKEGGVVVLHLGKSGKCDMAFELLKLGLHWFRTADILNESVEHCELHGIRDKGSVTSHQYLVLH